jgi:2-oxoglutarate ferredoxin oxidoreductase subunit alpha
LSRLINDFSVTVATVNGSGSQSANNILMRSIFRYGVPVAGKNLFPSNIAGLPTWFSIRVNEQGFVSRQSHSDIVIAMNKDTLLDDFNKLKPGGLFIYNSGLRVSEEDFPKEVRTLAIDFNKLGKEVSDSIQLRKLLVNVVYVGVLAELLGLPDEAVDGTIAHQFAGKKESIIEINRKAVAVGRQYVKDNLQDFSVEWAIESRDLNQGKILIDGNTAGALGLVDAGCTFAAWYPITPSSSLAEAFENYCGKLRKDKNAQNTYAMVQAEDELSAITMVAGAGWAGCRAMTATSGPGVSLMAETIGLMYFAEIPGLIWDVQRMGPSTGLPTRTSQGDVLSAAHCSHGDTHHPVLFPASPKECFEFARLGLDLAERAQTPVFVLSDLDLGMNFWTTERFTGSTEPYDRGKVLRADDLKKMEHFGRYEDTDGDGIPYRTLPGTPHDLAAYFTRGTGHTPQAQYSEDSENYQQLLDRLERKWQTIKTLVPAPEINETAGAKTGLVYFGSSQLVIEEVMTLLDDPPSLMRIKAFPFHRDVKAFLEKYDKVVVLEQNQHGQMAELLRANHPDLAAKIFSVTSCDGLPLAASAVTANLMEGGSLGH